MACIDKCVTHNVVSLDESASCGEAVRLMARHGIGSVGVRRATKLVGLVTERDLVTGVMGRADPDRTSVGEAMGSDVPTVSIHATDLECAQLMQERRTRHLLVRDGEEIVGVVSMLDLVDLVVAEKQWDIDQLQGYIRGGRAWTLSEPITTIFNHERAQGA